MDYNRITDNTYKSNLWTERRRHFFFEQAEVTSERMSYNTSLVQNVNLVIDMERLQNRYLLLANKGIGLVDTFDSNHCDATMLPEHLNPTKGVIADLSWFPSDNSLSATIQNSGKVVESLDVKLSSSCLSFDSTGTFPFSIAVGTRIGVRVCDFKSGTMVQTLKAKFDASCIGRNPMNPNTLLSGHSDGSLLFWDLRRASNPISALRIGQSPLRQVLLKQASSGLIYIGSANGLLSAIDLNLGKIVWSVLTETKGQGSKMFCMSNLTDLLVPESGLIRFVDAFSGSLLHSSIQECLYEPACVLRNEYNNDFIVADSHYIGQLYKFRARHRLKDNDETE